jgi:DNA-binding CsgD family transcriptional regulator
MRDFDTLVGAIYDCAANPDLWSDTLCSIRDSVGGAYALVGFVDTSEIANGHPPFTIRRNSPWGEEWLVKLEAILTSVPGGGGLFDTGVDVAWTQLTSSNETEFKTTDFYKHWVEPQGLRDTINTPYLQRATMMGMLSIPSYATREPYGDAETNLIERLTPHVRRAMMINDLTDKGKLAITLYRQVLDTLAVAVFVIGSGRRIVFTNASGDAMLAVGGAISLSNGLLQAKHVAGLPSALDDAIDRALKGDVAIGISGIGVPIVGDDGERLAAYVLPIAGKEVRGAMGLGHCVVFMARRGEHQPMAIEILRTMFDLTASEARIATLIAKGDGPQAISSALGISVNTVRSHLQHAYAKTNSRDQTGLGGLVNGLLPPVKEV